MGGPTQQPTVMAMAWTTGRKPPTALIPTMPTAMAMALKTDKKMSWAPIQMKPTVTRDGIPDGTELDNGTDPTVPDEPEGDPDAIDRAKAPGS